jgi:hypothetical protein
MRNAILQTDMLAAMETAKGMGFSPSSAASAALAQARQADATLRSAEACVVAVSTDPGLLSRLKTGRYSFSSGSISETCAKSYVLAHMNAIANRESVVAMACWAAK